MSRATKGDSTPAAAPSSAEAPAKAAPPRQPESWRDTFEQIVLAFVLALVFRTFEAEAFVIPTGSMAPTLYGRNKEMKCEQCGYDMVVGASSEVTKDSGVLIEGVRIEGALCPNCRYPNRGMEQARVFNGDRILVNKFPYELGEPHRWDVFVFKYPEKPGTNYIKRLVGLPNETLRIDGGDLYRVDENGQESILRKPPEKQRVLQMTVYNHDYRVPVLEEAGWPLRWASLQAAPRDGSDFRWTDDASGWTHDDVARSFSLASDASGSGLKWLRYRHLAPNVHDWQTISAGGKGQPKPRLIGDFCGYNAVWGRDPGFMHGEIEWSSPEQVETGSFWVGDLTINADLQIESPQPGAELVLELCEGPWWYRCRIDLNSGQARLLEVATHLSLSEERELGTAHTSLQGAGDYSIAFANVDDRICLWVNDALVDFGSGAEFVRPVTSSRRRPQWSDLAPVGIAVQKAAARVSHLNLERDIYYRSKGGGFDWSGGVLGDSMHDPEAWYKHYEESRQNTSLGVMDVDRMEIAIGPDQYLALGDNSPRSSDSRFWSVGHQTVPRNNLVGKAFWIYWPHGVPFLNDGRGYGLVSHRLTNGQKDPDYPMYVAPFYPDILRMKRIR